MIIDTHVHLYHKRFDADRDEVIERAREAGVQMMVMPAIDVPSIHAALSLCDAHEGLFAMSAIHPSDVKDATDADMEEVAALCSDPRIVAVGESGLDYYWDRTFDDKQHDYFRRHIRLAIDQDLPLVIHNRDATDDVLRILDEEKEKSSHPDRLRGILHCFGGPAEVVEHAIRLGFYFGIGGTVTFKNSGVAEVVSGIPLERIVVETDAPFLAPVPNRGKRNEPSYTKAVVDRIAEIHSVSVDRVMDLTTATARNLFGI